LRLRVKREVHHDSCAVAGLRGDGHAVCDRPDEAFTPPVFLRVAWASGVPYSGSVVAHTHPEDAVFDTRVDHIGGDACRIVGMKDAVGAGFSQRESDSIGEIGIELEVGAQTGNRCSRVRHRFRGTSKP
jgi:hypothetical protein